MNFVCANIEGEQSMQIDILPALKDFLDAYNDHAEMVVTEAVANAIDVKASEISVMLKADVNDNMTISFHNNGPSMNKKQFDDYHVIARSSKSKGSGIGFAGIGAKVYLAAWQEGTVIRTETTDGHATYASEMYVKNNVLKYAHVNPTIKKLGTSYTVRLKADDYRRLDKSLNQIIVDTFSPAIMNGLTVLVDGKRVKPWEPQHMFKRTFTVTASGMRFPTILRVTKDDIPVAKRYFQYHVSGKVITTKKPEWYDEVLGRYRNRIHAYVGAIQVSNHLNLNKTGFKSGSSAAVSAMFREVSRRIYDILKKEGYVEEQTIQNWEQTPLTRFFQNLFKDPEFAWLNPDPRGGTGPGVGNGKGGVPTGGAKRPKKKGTRQDGNGGEGVPPGGGAFSITYVQRPSDNKEGWLDPSTNKVVVNLDHPLFIKYEKNVQARNHRIGIILTSVLIKNGASKKEIDTAEAFDLQTRLLTMAKDVMW